MNRYFAIYTNEGDFYTVLEERMTNKMNKYLFELEIKGFRYNEISQSKYLELYDKVK